MKTEHRFLFADSRNMSTLEEESVDLMITSPPYPMIAMWDEIFMQQNPAISKALKAGEGIQAFDLMHGELGKVWQEVFRVLKTGGLACINIGDATSSMNGNFQLYPNHVKILEQCLALGFSALPMILWRKPTNAPNKFMGSGMIPPGAYVTLEHEYILILRKGPRRKFTAKERENRQKSAYFWEERNAWFSDIWFDLKGVPQKMLDTTIRKRSGAFPLELPYRLILMFSVKGDVVLDPFLGTGTTTLAAMTTQRNSIGLELNPHFQQPLVQGMDAVVTLGNKRLQKRLQDHLTFIKARKNEGKEIKYWNDHHDVPVMTRQEISLAFNSLQTIQKEGENTYSAYYGDPLAINTLF